MRQKHKQAIARCIALLLCVSMVMPAAAAPEGLGDAGLCEHHTQHTPQCGYQEEITGQPCAHVHDGSCGYQAPQEAQPCTHQHDEVCGYAAGSAEIPCDMGCEDTDGDGIADHADGCAYTPAQEGTPCGHVHDESCGYAEALEGQPCTHVHDEACGYVEGQEAVPCGYVCELCAQEQQEEPEEQPEEVLELFKEEPHIASTPEPLLASAWKMTGERQEAERVLQIGIYREVIVLLQLLASYMELCREKPEKYEETCRRLEAAAGAFRMDELHPGIMMPCYIDMAQGWTALGEEEKALQCLEKYTDLAVGEIYPLRLHGDAYFDLLDAWIDSALELGDYPPRDELLIRRSMTQALTENPAFAPLADDPRFQIMAERLKRNEKQ